MNEIENKNGNGKQSAASNLMQLMSFTADKVIEMADANSIIGEKIEIDGMVIIPVSKISAGFAGGGASMVNATVKKSNNPSGSGAQVKVTPLSFLVVSNGSVTVVDIQANEKSTKAGIIDAIIKQVKSMKSKKKEKKEEVEE